MQPRPQGLLVFQNGGSILENEQSLGTKLICMKSRHCLHFSSLSYDLTHRSRGRIYELNAKVFSSLQAILKEISAIKNCEIAVWQKR